LEKSFKKIETDAKFILFSVVFRKKEDLLVYSFSRGAVLSACMEPIDFFPFQSQRRREKLVSYKEKINKFISYISISHLKRRGKEIDANPFREETNFNRTRAAFIRAEIERLLKMEKSQINQYIPYLFILHSPQKIIYIMKPGLGFSTFSSD
jgi:hypothetical protein